MQEDIPATVELHSDTEKKVVTWDVAREGIKGDFPSQVITVSYGDEVHLFSPNTTPEELQNRIEEMNKEAA